MTSAIKPPLARAILDARAQKQRQSVIQAPADMAEAYAVQAAVAAEIGPVGGFKTSRKPTGSLMAPIFAKDIHASGARFDSTFGGALGIELEIGFRVKSVPVLQDGDLIAQFAQCLEPLVVIEMVETRLDQADPIDPLVQLADNQINAGLIAGPVLHDWQGATFGTVRARMMAGETCLVDGPTQVPGGDALETVAGLLRVLGQHCGGLQAGQIIITGTLHPLTYVAPGTAVAGWIDGFGEISVTL